MIADDGGKFEFSSNDPGQSQGDRCDENEFFKHGESETKPRRGSPVGKSTWVIALVDKPSLNPPVVCAAVELTKSRVPRGIVAYSTDRVLQPNALPFMFFSRFRSFTLFLTTCLSAAAQDYQWTAFAGLPPQSGFANGTGSAARFNTPFNVAANANGTVYVADTFNHAIRAISPAGVVTTLAGLGGASGTANANGTNARFFFPTGIMLARNAIFVTDRGNHTIRRVSFSGDVTLYAGRPNISGFADGGPLFAVFDQPSSLTADAAENLYVVDSSNHMIRRITPDGVVSTFAGLNGTPGSADGARLDARFTNPESITIDSTGVLYVADRGNHTIRRISPEGTVTTLAGAPGLPGAVNATGAAARFQSPSGVIAYANGSVIVIDSGNSALRLVTPNGAVSLLAGQLDLEGYRNGAALDARFFQPGGAAFTTDGIVVADTLNHSIRKLDGQTFTTTLLAGGGGNFGRQDGLGAAALFNYPTGVATHSSGDIYVADTRGASIRRISPAGLVQRVAGAELGGDAYRDGVASVQSLNYPIGVAVAPDRTIYFCEYQRHTIRRVLPNGTVETVAGLEGVAGSVDGADATARFNLPGGVALDADGNLFVADTGNHSIRRIAAGTRTVTTLAGTTAAGSTDGVGAAARFNLPRGVATDVQGNVYVADSGNHTLRKIGRDGVVSTVAGAAGIAGSANGSPATSRFSFPYAVAVDAIGRIFIAEAQNATIRMIRDNTVATIGGSAGFQSFAEGVGTAAAFFTPNGIAIDANGNLYVSQSGSNLVAKGTPLTAPSIGQQPQAVIAAAGGSVTFSVGAAGGGLTYQWNFNGGAIPGATNATYSVSGVTPSAAGNYSVTITNPFGTITSQNATLTVGAASTAGRLINLSILTSVDSPPGESFTMGFVVGGSGTTGTKPLVIRAAGPSLGFTGLQGLLSDPKLELFSGPTATAGNDNWGGSTALADAMASVGAFQYNAPDSRDAASVGSFASGDNSVKVTGVGSATGVVIAEIYDATPSSSFTASTPRLLNVSVLKHIGDGLTAGFTLGGSTPKNILIRGIGPTLTTAFGVQGTVTNPEITLFSGTTTIGGNDDWGGGAVLATAFRSVAAFDLPAGSQDAALAVTLSPGGYTVRVTGKNGTTGVALVEIYELP